MGNNEEAQMRKPGIILSAALVFMLSGAAWAAEFFDVTIGDFAEELRTAQKQGKKAIMLFFEEEDCPFCHWMKERIFTQPEVQRLYRKNFLVFSVDMKGDAEITDFKGKTLPQKKYARNNRVRATPTFIFFDLNGNEITRYLGATQTPEEFIWLGEYVARGVYKEMPFVKYKQQRLKEKSK